MAGISGCDLIGQTLATWLLTTDDSDARNRLFARLSPLDPVAYAEGLTVSNPRTTVTWEGNVYIARPDQLPFTTGAELDPLRWRMILNNGTGPGGWQPVVAELQAQVDELELAVAQAPGTLADLVSGPELTPSGTSFPDVPSVSNAQGPVDAVNDSLLALAERSKNLNDRQVLDAANIALSIGRTTEAWNLADLGDQLQTLPLGRRVRLLTDDSIYGLKTESTVIDLGGGVKGLSNRDVVDLREMIWTPRKYGLRASAANTYAAQNKLAIDECIDAMPSDFASYGALSGVLFIPMGVFVTDGNHVLSKRIVVMSPAANIGILRRGNGSTGPLIRAASAQSGVARLGFSGNPNNAPDGGPTIQLDAAYTFVDDIFSDNAASDDILVNTAIEWKVTKFKSRRARGYGLRTVAGAGCTDGVGIDWSIGQSGLSAFRLDTGSQNLTDIHTFGSGHLSTTDNHGGYINSGKNKLTNYQGETNMGYGLYVNGAGSRGNQLNGGSLWGNVQSGLGINGAPDGQVSKVDIERNGVANTGGSASDLYAAVNNVAGMNWQIDIRARDYASALPATSADQQWGTYNYPGRTAVFTQSAAYASSSGADFNKISGIGRKEDTRSGTSVRNSGSSGRNDDYSDFEQGNVAAPASTIVSGAVRIPSDAPGRLTRITQASTEISSIVGLRSGQEGFLMWDLASGVPGNLVASSSLILTGGAATFAPANKQVIRFKAVSDGTSNVIVYQV